MAAAAAKRKPRAKAKAGKGKGAPRRPATPRDPATARTPGGHRFQVFCRQFLRQTIGQWDGQPLELEPWQLVIADGLFATDRNGRRLHKEALVGIPRKNGKSTLCSAIALYMLLADGEAGAQVYSAASSKPQARIVFDQARDMVLASPLLRDLTTVHRDTIRANKTNGIYRVIAADAPKQHGLNPSAVIVDELHAHEDGGELYYALRTALKARRQPLMVSITTAGYDLDTIAGDLYERGRRGEQKGLFFHWLTVDDSQLDNTRAWKAANPASWITEASLVEDSEAMPRFVFERLHLNRWTGSEALWLPPSAWKRCRSNAVIPDGAEIYVGVDLGLKHDCAAVAWVYPGRDGAFVARSFVWGLWPDHSKPQPPANVILDEEQLPIKLPKQLVRELARRYDVIECAYDPYRFTDAAQDLGDEGIEMVEFLQSDARMVPASSGLYQAIMERRVLHDGDRFLAKHLENVAASHTNSGWRMQKKKAKRPMDAASALAFALARARQYVPEERPDDDEYDEADTFEVLI